MLAPAKIASGGRMADNETADSRTVKRRTRKSQAPDQTSVVNEANPGSAPEQAKSRRGRTNRPFPAGSFEDAMSFAKEIYNLGSGTPVRRLTLFDHLQRQPDSSLSRMLERFPISLHRSRRWRSSWRIPAEGRGRGCGRWRSRDRGWCARRLCGGEPSAWRRPARSG